MLGPPSPGALVGGFNAALAAAQQRISEAAASPAAAWGWPPPECKPVPGAARTPPARWHEAAQQGALSAALQAAQLPPFPHQDLAVGAHACTGPYHMSASGLHQRRSAAASRLIILHTCSGHYTRL